MAHIVVCMFRIRRMNSDLGRPARHSVGDNLISILCMATMCAKKRSQLCNIALLEKAQGAEVLILHEAAMNAFNHMLIWMHADEHEKYRIRYSLHRKRFGREGVFESEYPYIYIYISHSCFA